MVDTGDGGNFAFNNGDLATDSGFYTAIYLSLFGGDQPFEIFIPEPDRGTLEFIESLNDVITLANLGIIESKANKALAWMITDSVIDSISVTASSPELNLIKLIVLLTQGDVENRYTIYWDRERQGIARIATNL